MVTTASLAVNLQAQREQTSVGDTHGLAAIETLFSEVMKADSAHVLTFNDAQFASYNPQGLGDAKAARQTRCCNSALGESFSRELIAKFVSQRSSCMPPQIVVDSTRAGNQTLRRPISSSRTDQVRESIV